MSSPEPPQSTSGRPDKTATAIRAALSHPRDIEAFGGGLPVVLDQARETRDWAVLDEFLHTWWHLACDSVRDPEGRARMWETADRLNRGEDVPTLSRADIEALIRRRGTPGSEA